MVVANFTIIKEDHTIGNLLKSGLLQHDDIHFAGYRMPHPLENLLELKVKTDGKSTPLEKVKQVTSERLREVNWCEKQFIEALKNYRGNQQHGYDNV